jgi:bifunctional non-homologous end joining protein LigD
LKPDISADALRLYYRLVAPLMMPWIDGRVLNLFRCKEGRCFFQRSRAHPPSGATFQPPIRFIPLEQKNGRREEYLFVDSIAGVLACADADAVEFHGWASRAQDVERPDRLVIDLDPGEGVGFAAVRAAAHQVRRSFAELGLEGFALLTGAKGIHVVVPIVPAVEWAEVRQFAKLFCMALAEAAPKRFTVALSKERRRGRIFLDFLRNQRTATAVLPYSARARPGMPVAAPVSWAELDQVECSDAFTVGHAEQLVCRSNQASIVVWGVAAQSLPRLT